MFIQPDWWEVTQAGVGTNRYAYSGNDPVNGVDPGGNETYISIQEASSAGGVGEIRIVVTAAWNNDNRQGFHLSDAEISNAFKSQSGRYENVVTPRNSGGGSYNVGFQLRIVNDAETSYDMSIASSLPRGAAGMVTGRAGHGANDKILELLATAGLSTVRHELNHFAGADDHYEEDDIAVPRRTRPDPGWAGNTMAENRWGTTLDGRNVSEMIAAPIVAIAIFETEFL